MKMEYKHRSWWPLYILYTLLAFCVLRFGIAATSYSMHWRPDYDTNIYFLIGRGWVESVLPYVQLSDLKGPFVFLQCGLGSMLSPDSFLGVCILQAPLIGLGVLYACKSAALFVGRSLGMVVSGFLFVYLWYFGVHPSATVLTLQYISLYHVLDSMMKGESLGRWPVYAMGVFVGIVLLIKFNLVAFWVPMGLYALWGREWRRNACLLLAGVSTVLLPAGAGMAWAGMLEACWQEYILVAVRYGGTGAGHSALLQCNWELLAEMLPKHFQKVDVPIVQAVCGGLQLFVWLVLPRLVRIARVRSYYAVLGGCFLLCLVAIFGGQYHYEHYYYSFLPFVLLSLVAGVGVLRRLRCTPKAPLVRAAGVLLPVLLTIFTMAHALYTQARRAHNGSGAICHSSQSLVKLLQGSSFICVEPYSCLHFYRLTGTIPPIRHFIPQMIPNGTRKHRQEVLNCLQNHHVRFVVCTIEHKENTEALIVESGLPYARVPLNPPDFPPCLPVTDQSLFCLYERR